MNTQPLLVTQGVCSRDAELASLWLAWTTFLAEQPGGSVRDTHLLVVMAMSVTAEQEAKLRAAVGTGRSNYFRALFVRLQDERENAYPLSASHLFLRTLECAEKLFPGSPILWCEADTVAMKPTWFGEIEAEYSACGKPFMGVKVDGGAPHMSGVGIYPADWRTLAPSIAGVLEAPDLPMFGVSKGQAWDIFCRHDILPQMAETRRIEHKWKHRNQHGTPLADVAAATCIYHQEKTGSLLMELAAARYPEFMSTLPSDRKFYLMNGHPSRLHARGMRIKFSYTNWQVGGHRSAVCSDELDDDQAMAIATIVGQLGVSEITEEAFLKLTGRTAKSLPPARVRKNQPAALSDIAPVLGPDGVTHPSVFVMLGRFGDIMNILPMLKAEADAGRRPTLVVSQEFASILDGVSYCDRIVWDGAYDRLSDALRWLRREKGIQMPVVAQCHRNPRDQGRLTPSYQTEIWRLAGRLDQFENRGALIFDQRDKKRETKLVWDLVGEKEDASVAVLVGLESSSSPLPADVKAAIMSAIKSQFGKSLIIDLSTVRAERIYDLLALFEYASLIVTCDTSFFHLSRATNRPVVAILNNAWRGSVPHENCLVIRYAEAIEKPARVGDLVKKAFYGEDAPGTRLLVADAENYIAKLETKGPTPDDLRTLELIHRHAAGETQARIFHAYDPCGTDARHLKAQASWKALYETEGIIGMPFPRGGRDAKLTIKDPRPLPYLKDIIEAGIPADALDTDIVAWSNSDIGFAPGIGAALRQHIGQHQCAAMRRTESNGKGHPGRDLVAFTVGWWRANSAKFPDYIIGAPIFDLGIVALFRHYHKLPALTMKTLDDDVHPADMTPGFALHESHDPEWMVANTDHVPSVRHNRAEFVKWAKKNCPEIKFSKGGSLQ